MVGTQAPHAAIVHNGQSGCHISETNGTPGALGITSRPHCGPICDACSQRPFVYRIARIPGLQPAGKRNGRCRCRQLNHRLQTYLLDLCSTDSQPIGSKST